MIKQIGITALLALALTAGQYAKLKDGSVIILKDDGTWEKVETIPSGTSVAPATTAPQAPSTTQATTQPQQPKIDPLAKEYTQKLQGTWENFDGSLRYVVKGDKVLWVQGRKKREGAFTLQNIKPQKRQFLMNIAEYGKTGPFSFGGVYRKLGFSPDFQTLTDYSVTIPTELHKVR
jgi:hypothetical protein